MPDTVVSATLKTGLRYSLGAAVSGEHDRIQGRGKEQETLQLQDKSNTSWLLYKRKQNVCYLIYKTRQMLLAIGRAYRTDKE